MNKKIKKEIERMLVKSKVLFDEPMSRHTSIRIGGPAEAFVLIEDIDELKKILTFTRRENIPLFVVGRGTNLLVSDKGIKGIVLKLGRSFDWIKFKGNSKWIPSGKVFAGSSTPIKKLLKETSAYGLSGLEFMAGIPGTLGGAVVSNAGSPQKSIGDFISSVRFMTLSGKIITRKRSNLQFSYRFSNFKNEKVIILEVVLDNLKRENKDRINSQISLLLEKRRKNQPLGFPSAGCIFKNPPISSAGVLIDFAGLKGVKIGGAQISKKHANFILNVGSAKEKDVSMLIEKVRKKIYNLFRINLELEIKKVRV